MPGFGKKLRPLLLILTMAVIWTAGCVQKSEDDYFKRADQLYDRGRFAEAVFEYQMYLERFPSGRYRAEAWFLSGNILYYTLNRRAEGVKQFSALVNEYPAHDLAFQAREILAGAFKDDIKDFNQAILEYKWLIRSRPQSPKAPEYHFSAAQCQVLDENLEEAILEFGRFLTAYPNSELSERVLDELAEIHRLLGRNDQALYIYRTLIQRFPQSDLRTIVEFKIGNTLEELFRFDEALAVYENLMGRYENQRALNIRIRGVKERKKNKLGTAPNVNYDYRPAFTPDMLKNYQKSPGDGEVDGNLKDRDKK